MSEGATSKPTTPQNGPSAPPTATAAPQLIPFGHVLGYAPRGIPAFSNGPDPQHISGETSLAPAAQTLIIGPQWSSLEFARRYLMAAKGCCLPGVTTSESLWTHNHVIHVVTRRDVPLIPFLNGGSIPPIPTDLLVWRRNSEFPFGHVAVITEVGPNFIRIAEQNLDTKSWDGKSYSRELPLQSAVVAGVARFDVYDTHPNPPQLLGWMRVDMVDMDATMTDWMDTYRSIVGKGHLKRIPVEDSQRNPQLPWLTPTEAPTDFFLHRSLVDPQTKEAHLKDIPSGYYTLDYDLWTRIKKGAGELHRVALKACERVLNLPNSTEVLRDQFGIPEELHDHLRETFATTPCLAGRFDFGFDGKKLKVFEYNSDSSAAMLECGDTMGKWAKWAGIDHIGHSCGQLLFTRLVVAWHRFKRRTIFAPVHRYSQTQIKAPKLIHFLVDDDDEERYTAIYMMKAAQEAGFQTRMVIGMKDLRYNAKGDIVDSNGTQVLCVWKTWSWDTVLKDYERRKSDQGKATGGATDHHPSEGDTPESRDVMANTVSPAPQSDGGLATHSFAGSTYSENPERLSRDDGKRELQGSDTASNSPAGATEKENPISLPKVKNPTLSEVMLRKDICVIEPMWKMLAGNKALLPYLVQEAPGHENLLEASFELTPSLRKSGYVSKPVSGRAGQNISIHAAEDHDHHAEEPSTPKTTDEREGVENDSFDEATGGRFADKNVVYQEKLHLKQYDGYFPILCAWVVDDSFAGIVIREDTSLITRLESIVAPSRVVRW